MSTSEQVAGGAAEELKNKIAVLLDDGGGEAKPQAPEDEELTKFKAEIEQIAKDAAYSVNQRRFDAEEVRFCVWEGQTPDGKKHSAAMNGAQPFPFEGASDARIRLADMIVNERVLLLVAAAMRALPKVQGMELRKEGFAGRIQTLLRWVIQNQLVGEFTREITKLAQFQEADSPAGAVLGVWWWQEYALKLEPVTSEQLVQTLHTVYGMDFDALKSLETMLMDPARDAESAEFLVELSKAGGLDEQVSGEQGAVSGGQPAPAAAPPPSPQPSPAGQAEPGGMAAGEERPAQTAGPTGEERPAETASPTPEAAPISKKRARIMVKELRATGATTYPKRYLRVNRPKLCAYRLFDDFFFPANSTDLQRARCCFVREWLSEVDLRERQHSMGYSKEFIDEALKHEAQTGFPLYKRDPVQGDFAVARQENKETFKQLFEIITVFYKAVNDDDVPAIYTFPFHHAVEFAAKPREMLEYEHGKYPFVYFTREVLTQRLWDARGVPELISTDQQALKLLHDSYNDAVQLTTVPPIKVPRRRGKLGVVIGPLRLIKEDRPGDVAFMEGIARPDGNEKQQAQILARVNEHFGRVCETVMPQLQQLHATGMTTWFLENLREAFMMIIDLCQQYMTAEELQLVTGADNLPIAKTPEDIQGRYNLNLSFNASALNLDYLKVVFELILKYVLPVDTLGTVQRDRLVQWMFSAVDANLAQDMVLPAQTVQQGEVKDEEDNFAKIAAGVEPQMVAEGQNFALRLQVLQGIAQKNPEAIQKLSPVSQKIFQARVKYLINQVQQLKNAQIGRQVGQPALGQDPSTGAGPAPGLSAGAQAM